MLPATAQTVTEETKRKVKVVVHPEYPQLARDLKMQGVVRLQATVSADGKVLNVKERGGNPVLVDAAVKAVKKWKYEAGAKDTVEDVKLEFVL